MTATPLPTFATRPNPPEAGSAEYKQWKQEFPLTFPGGTLTAAYGNLVQTWNVGQIANFCQPDTVSVERSATTRVDKIGGDSINVAASSFTIKRYSKKNASQAAAGQPITIVTDIGQYQARLTGPLEDLMAWACQNSGLLYSTIYIYSERGAKYGPITLTGQN